MGTLTTYTFDGNTKIVCIEDHKTVRCGFLWLKTKQVKIEGLTKGKKYSILNIQLVDYGGPSKFMYARILNDDGLRYIYDGDLFKGE